MIKITSASASGSLNFSGSVSASVKSALSISHFEAAKLFSAIAEQTEREQMAFQYPQPKIGQLRSYSIAATILSVSAVESKINEMFLHVVDGTLPPMKSVLFEKMEILKEVWKDIEKITTLRKYQLFLLAADSHGFDISAEPYQSMSLLIRLRNALIHLSLNGAMRMPSTRNCRIN